MTETKWALRRSPTVDQEIFGPDSNDNYMGLVNGVWCRFHLQSQRGDSCDLIPLQQPKREPLRCFYNFYDGGEGYGYDTREEAQESASTNATHGAVPMVEAAELDRVKAAGQALADAMEGSDAADWRDALAAWKEAVK